jgi:hypothetical protein
MLHRQLVMEAIKPTLVVQPARVLVLAVAEWSNSTSNGHL